MLHLGPTPTTTAGANLQPGQGDPQLPSVVTCVMGDRAGCASPCCMVTPRPPGDKRGLVARSVLHERQACHHPSQFPLEGCWLMGTRLDTGHPVFNLLPWPRPEQSHLQGDKECAPGDGGAWARQGADTQAKGCPLPCPVPLSRVAAGSLQGPGVSPALPSPPCLGVRGLQSSHNLCHQLWSKASGSCTGKQKHREGGQSRVWGRHPPNHQQNWGWGVQSGHSKHVPPTLGLTGRMPGG